MSGSPGGACRSIGLTSPAEMVNTGCSRSANGAAFAYATVTARISPAASVSDCAGARWIAEVVSASVGVIV